MQGSFLLVALVCVNAYFLVTALTNIVYLGRATRKPRVKSGPFVSVIVPARDEERSIARCLDSLLEQDYADYEIVVVDDQSSDATARIVADLAARHPRLRPVSGKPLPDGWLGKPHALSQGAAVARGEILIVTDADTVHGPESVSWAVTNLEDHRADILSGYLDQRYGGFGESMVVPTMYAAMLTIPLWLVPRTRGRGPAFAIGQYVAIRREALDGICGFEAIRHSIVDDMSMAARMKESGYRNVFLDARGAASCRLYHGFRDAFRGIERSVYSAVGGRPLPVAAVAVIVLGVIAWPALSALASLALAGAPQRLVMWSAGLFAVQWALVSWDRKIPFVAFALYPVVFLDLLVILTSSMLRTGFGKGVDWKGRTVRVPRDAGAACEPRVAGAGSRPGRVRWR